MPKRIAIIEDEVALAENYKAALEREKYAVDVYHDRQSAQTAFAQCLPDMAIIDIELGDDVKGGHALCQELREQSKILPIMFLTARDSELDEIIGLNLGANDYLAKSITVNQLLARVESMFKWYEAMSQPAATPKRELRDGPLMLDIDCMSVAWRGAHVDLTHSEFLVLACLAKHPGHVKTHQQLMDAADKTIERESVGSYIKRIRKAFQKADPGCNPIKTEYGVGYSWQGDKSP